MDLKNLISKLHPLERTVIPVLKEHTELSDITQVSGLKEVEIIRALQWLENKKILTTITKKRKMVSLEANGEQYKKEGLPEKTFLTALEEDFKGLNVITKKTKLSREEVNACLGILKKKQAIATEKGEFLQVKITDEGKKIVQSTTKEEEFLKQNFPLPLDQINDQDTLNELQKRKDFLKIDEEKNITIQLTKLGEELLMQDLGGEVVNRITTGMLKTGEWKNKQFRAYDVEINVPTKYPGKKHFVNQASEYAKRVWMDMGFKEMTGNMVQTSFWNFDALFTPQDHPVREMQDTFFLGGKVEKGSLPDHELVDRVKWVHENGGDTNSKGWQYDWDSEEAKRNVLRTHTTVLTAKILTNLKNENLPAKFFALGKNFRNEALDWKHLFEFNQTEGIVVDENANFRHLLGYLKKFFEKMGFPKARFRPAFFPYTEPSVEIDVFHPIKKEWVEFGGAGMLRPEVVTPLLGKDISVLAWGPGFDRTILEYWKITDIRQLYKNDLGQMRKMREWLK
jgi:phenylalanyl-tRNA synthetase alpha chain